MMDIEPITAGLTDRGWAATEGFFSANLIHSLLQDIGSQRAEGGLRRAGIGVASTVRDDIRTDVTRWLTGETAAQREYLEIMETMREDLNRSLFLGLALFEAHYAEYQSGGFYKKHVDALKGVRNRIISTVTYLTPEWTEADGGHLVLYDADNRELNRVLPRAGTLAIFLSEDIPHEVLPPKRPRCSIAGWFRCR